MIMKYITKIISTIQKAKPVPLGRWNINYCNKQINRKIDLANEDNCGPCGEYAITKKELKNKNDVQIKNNKS